MRYECASLHENRYDPDSALVTANLRCKSTDKQTDPQAFGSPQPWGLFAREACRKFNAAVQSPHVTDVFLGGAKAEGQR